MTTPENQNQWKLSLNDQKTQHVDVEWSEQVPKDQADFVTICKIDRNSLRYT